MVSSGMLRRVALVITDVSKEPISSFIRMARIGELGTTLAVTSNRRTLRRNTKSVLTRGTRRNIPEDTILHSHRRENLKSYKSSNVKFGALLNNAVTLRRSVSCNCLLQFLQRL
jgi:hypothetical protein